MFKISGLATRSATKRTTLNFKTFLFRLANSQPLRDHNTTSTLPNFYATEYFFFLKTNQLMQYFSFTIGNLGGNCSIPSQIGYIWWPGLEFTRVAPSVERTTSKIISSEPLDSDNLLTGKSQQTFTFLDLHFKFHLIFLETISFNRKSNFRI